MDIEARARRARELIQDPLLMEVFERIEGETIAAWKATKGGEQAQRDLLWLTVKATSRVMEVLNSVADDGVIFARRAARPIAT